VKLVSATFATASFSVSAAFSGDTTTHDNAIATMQADLVNAAVAWMCVEIFMACSV
jgi:hypothetical protein